MPECRSSKLATACEHEAVATRFGDHRTLSFLDVDLVSVAFALLLFPNPPPCLSGDTQLYALGVLSGLPFSAPVGDMPARSISQLVRPSTMVQLN